MPRVGITRQGPVVCVASAGKLDTACPILDQTVYDHNRDGIPTNVLRVDHDL